MTSEWKVDRLMLLCVYFLNHFNFLVCYFTFFFSKNSFEDIRVSNILRCDIVFSFLARTKTCQHSPWSAKLPSLVELRYFLFNNNNEEIKRGCERVSVLSLLSKFFFIYGELRNHATASPKSAFRIFFGRQSRVQPVTRTLSQRPWLYGMLIRRIPLFFGDSFSLL